MSNMCLGSYPVKPTKLTHPCHSDKTEGVDEAKNSLSCSYQYYIECLQTVVDGQRFLLY